MDDVVFDIMFLHKSDCRLDKLRPTITRLGLCVSIYIYIYIYMCVCVCVVGWVCLMKIGVCVCVCMCEKAPAQKSSDDSSGDWTAHIQWLYNVYGERFYFSPLVIFKLYLEQVQLIGQQFCVKKRNYFVIYISLKGVIIYTHPKLRKHKSTDTI